MCKMQFSYTLPFLQLETYLKKQDGCVTIRCNFVVVNTSFLKTQPDKPLSFSMITPQIQPGNKSQLF